VGTTTTTPPAAAAAAAATGVYGPSNANASPAACAVIVGSTTSSVGGRCRGIVRHGLRYGRQKSFLAPRWRKSVQPKAALVLKPF
jgi:hypothetical protein